MRRLNTWGDFDINRICAVLICTGRAASDDPETSRRFAEAREILRSVGMDIIVAVPEGKEQPRHKRWRTNRTRRFTNET